MALAQAQAEMAPLAEMALLAERALALALTEVALALALAEVALALALAGQQDEFWQAVALALACTHRWHRPWHRPSWRWLWVIAMALAHTVVAGLGETHG